MKGLTILSVLLLFVSGLFAGVAEEDSMALVQLYKYTDGDNWYSNENWLTSRPIRNWYGITLTDDAKHVKWINLQKNNLSGKLPAELGALKYVEYLNLSLNHIQGEIPEAIGEMASLQKLILESNQLTGKIPESLAGYTNIHWIYLSNNLLEGKIPAEFAKLQTLTQLKLGNNNLEGEIPESLGKLPVLYYLYLNDNHFVGDVPESFRELTNLAHLYLYNNNLEKLPDFSHLSSLTRLWVKGNHLTFGDLEANIDIESFSYTPQDSIGKKKNNIVNEGESITLSVKIDGTANYYQWFVNGNPIGGATDSVYTIKSALKIDEGAYVCQIRNKIVLGLSIYSRPQNIKVLTKRQVDSLALVALYNATDGANWINKWDLTVPLDTWYGVKIDSNRVVELNLKKNNLKGAIPDEIGSLAELSKLVLANSDLSKGISDSLASLRKLEYLDLNYCSLTDIPASIGQLENLNKLFLTGNGISGTIPKFLSKLEGLVEIRLSLNDFEGTIPNYFGEFKDLQALGLRNNRLSGEVPESFKALTNLQDLNLKSNLLSELPDLSALPKLFILLVNENKFTFEDLEANMSISNFSYIPQDSVGEAVDTLLDAGVSYTMSVEIGGNYNHYQWYKNGEEISDADSSVYEIASVSEADSGEYICAAVNDSVPNLTIYSRPVKIRVKNTTGIGTEFNGFPEEFTLEQNYPNPFNPSTKISFALPEAAKVTVTVYNILGQRVALLLDAQKSAGYHSLIFNAADLSAGLYLYEIKTEKFHSIKKMLLVK